MTSAHATGNPANPRAPSSPIIGENEKDSPPPAFQMDASLPLIGPPSTTDKPQDTHDHQPGSDTKSEGKEGQAKKKSRTEAWASTNNGARGEQKDIQRATSVFYDVLPLDVVYEIFGYMHPRDLLLLARTSKALREVLMSRHANSIWRDALSAAEEFPDRPSDQSPMQWTQLVAFTDCMICWRGYQEHNINWVLRLRGCRQCLRDNVISTSRALKEFQEYGPEMVQDALALLPYSKPETPNRRPSKSRVFYYRPSIISILNTLAEYNSRISAGVDGVLDELEEFKAQKLEESTEMVETGESVEAWVDWYIEEKGWEEQSELEGQIGGSVVSFGFYGAYDEW